jgi:HEAT repeat protein
VQLSPKQLAYQLHQQLQSLSVRERVLAILELQKSTLPVELALPLIEEALADPNPQIRGMAVFTLGIKPTTASLPLLTDILVTDPDYNIRAMAAGALGYLGDPQALEPLRHAFYEDTQWLVQFSAAVALGNLQAPEAEAVLLTALASQQTLLQEAAIMALGEIRAVAALNQLLPFAVSNDWLLRKRLAEALANLPDPRSESMLKTLCSDSSPQVAKAAQFALQQLAELL